MKCCVPLSCRGVHFSPISTSRTKGGAVVLFYYGNHSGLIKYVKLTKWQLLNYLINHHMPRVFFRLIFRHFNWQKQRSGIFYRLIFGNIIFFKVLLIIKKHIVHPRSLVFLLLPLFSVYVLRLVGRIIHHLLHYQLKVLRVTDADMTNRMQLHSGSIDINHMA